jgi:pimeloyl-ACP methyl ester carboxylesterase
VLGGYPGARPWAAADAKAAIDAAVELEGATPFRSLILAIAPTDEPRPSEEAIRTRSRELTKRNDPLALAAYNRSRGALAVTAEQLAAVRVPMLGVIGSADSFLPGLQSLQKSVPQLEIVVIEGATHVGERDARKRPEFIRAVRAFIASHR